MEAEEPSQERSETIPEERSVENTIETKSEENIEVQSEEKIEEIFVAEKIVKQQIPVTIDENTEVS